MATRVPAVDGALLSSPVASRHGVFFWLLRTLVKVRYTFFLSAFLLGLRRPSVVTLFVWVGVLFIAILLHELGHALAARFYRQNPQIELHAMGGTTSWTWIDELKWWQRVIISFAGPGIGFLVGGLLYLGYTLVPVDEPYLLRLARYDFLWVSIAWGVFNLLPDAPTRRWPDPVRDPGASSWIQAGTPDDSKSLLHYRLCWASGWICS